MSTENVELLSQLFSLSIKAERTKSQKVRHSAKMQAGKIRKRLLIDKP